MDQRNLCWKRPLEQPEHDQHKQRSSESKDNEKMRKPVPSRNTAECARNAVGLELGRSHVKEEKGTHRWTCFTP